MRNRIVSILEGLSQSKVSKDYPWMVHGENKKLNAIGEYDLKTSISKWNSFL